VNSQLSAGPSASLTYEPFYGLSEKPFSLSADPRFLFKSPAHAPAFDALLAGIRRREGLIVLTGEIGTGKTTLCRSVLQQLDRRTFATFVPDPFVSREDLMKMLLVDFGVISIGDLKSGRLNGASRPDLSYPLYEFLDSLVPLQAFAVLVIDEAQKLSLPLLEEIRILSELERREKLLQVVLVGQPELRSNLKLPQMRQVDQRVSVRCELAPHDAEGVAGYVKHRLAVAAAGENRVEFTRASLDAVYQASCGVPRLINRICDRALERGYSLRSHKIDPKFVWEAIDDLGLSPASGVDDWPAQGYAASEQPPTPKPPAVMTTLAEAQSVLSNFAPETELSAARPAAIDHSSARAAAMGHSSARAAAIGHSSARRPWIGVAVASLFAVAAFAGGLWFLSAQTVDSDAIAALLPPPPPRTFVGNGITPHITDDAAVSDPPPADPAAPAASGVSGESPAPSGVSGASKDYFIQVASFESRARAERLVEELTSAGYRAREVELDLGPPRGRLLQVIVGGYSSAIEVQRDLQSIRELPGYSDALLIDR
jgi:type II secretory pathway predicted ATPase ExeA/cell division septation protein DedD